MKHRQAANPVGAVIVLVFLGGLFLFPLLVTFAGSFMTEQAIGIHYSSKISVFDLAQGLTEKFKTLLLIPNPASVEQYAGVLVKEPAFLILLFNSLVITAPVTACSLVVALLSAYGFTIWGWKHKEKLFVAYIVVMLMPLQAVLVPNYLIAALLGIQKSRLAIILPGIFAPFPFFLMRQSLKAMPPAYFEAALIDGAGHWQTLFLVIVPQLKSAIAALSMLTFIEYWNLVEQAVIFIEDYRKEPLSVYLSRLAEGRTGLIFAASCVYLFVPLWFLFAGQNDLEKGIELSGVK